MIIILIAKLIAAEMIRIHDSKSDNKSEQKRKAVKDFSENSHIKKCWNCMQKMIDLEQKLKQYKNNDWQTWAVEVKKLWETQAYKNASESEKKNMKKKTKKNIIIYLLISKKMIRTKQMTWKLHDEKISQNKFSLLADHNDKNNKKNNKKILRKIIKQQCKSESMCRL